MKGLEIGLNRIISIFWDDKKVYKATVQDEDEDFFSITIPAAEGNYLFLKEGDWISATFNDDKGNVYKFTTGIIKRKIDNNIPMYVLNIPEKFIKVQRRNYVRVSTILPVEYARFKVDSETIFDVLSPATLLDLSGGGLKIKIKNKLDLSEKIAVKIKYNDEEVIVKGKIVRVDKTEGSEFICGLLFENIYEKDRDKVIKIVFTIMRKQRSVI